MTSLTPHWTILTVHRRQGQLRGKRGCRVCSKSSRRLGRVEGWGRGHARVAVQDCALGPSTADSLPASFEERILLGVQAQALVERLTNPTQVPRAVRRRRSPFSAAAVVPVRKDVTLPPTWFWVVTPPIAVRVAPPTPAFPAIPHSPRRAVVTGTDDALLAHEDGSDAAFHAIGAEGRERGEQHEVGVPRGAEQFGQDREREGGEERREGGVGVREGEVREGEDRGQGGVIDRRWMGAVRGCR
jgi:hypothetical protein